MKISIDIKKIAVLLALFVFIIGCSTDDDLSEAENNPDTENNNEGNTAKAPSVPVIVDPNNEDDFVELQTFDHTLRITFSGTSATIENSVEGVSIAQSGAGVTITSKTKGVEYIVSGSASNGFLKFYSDDKFKLQLDGVSIVNPSGPAINIQSGKYCYVVLGEGKSNSLTDGSAYTSGSEDQKGCFFSEGELIFSGKGAINIKGNNKHGICSDDYVRIREGSVTISSAVTDGIHTNNAFIMDDGTLSVASSSDGIECEYGYIHIKGGTVTLNTSDDGIVTSFEGSDTSVNPAIVISDGKITVNTTAQKGHGLKSTGDISVTGGNHYITTKGAAAKGMNADGNVVIAGASGITITTSGNTIVENSDTSSASGVKTGKQFGMTGGTLTVKSSGTGGKGISADGNIIIEDGTLTITTTGGSYSSGRLTSRPKGIKTDANFTIHGGTLVVSATHEGIEAANTLTFNGGRTEVNATDDAINASTSGTGQVVINGGYLYCNSSGNDAVDSNGTITINGGVVVAEGTGSPEEAFDSDSRPLYIHGGTVIGIGGSNQTSLSSSGKQYAIAYGAGATSGQYVALQNASGENILVYKIPKTYSSMKMVLSHPSLAKGSYAIRNGGTLTGGTEEFKGYYTGGTYSGGTSTSFTISSVTTTVGSTSGGGGKP